MGLGEECMTCKEKINISVIDPPPSYLITVINRTQDNSDEFVCLTDERGRRLSFEMISFASYNGNGSTGHYTCLINREEGGSNTTTPRLKVLRQSLNGEEFQGLAFTKGVMGRLTDDRYFESMK